MTPSEVAKVKAEALRGQRDFFRAIGSLAAADQCEQSAIEWDSAADDAARLLDGVNHELDEQVQIERLEEMVRAAEKSAVASQSLWLAAVERERLALLEIDRLRALLADHQPAAPEEAWEYAVAYSDVVGRNVRNGRTHCGPDRELAERVAADRLDGEVLRRRAPGPWEPVPAEREEHCQCGEPESTHGLGDPPHSFTPHSRG